MTVNTGGTAQDTIERLQAKIKELEASDKDKSQLLASFRSQIQELEEKLARGYPQPPEESSGKLPENK